MKELICDVQRGRMLEFYNTLATIKVTEEEIKNNPWNYFIIWTLTHNKKIAEDNEKYQLNEEQKKIYLLYDAEIKEMEKTYLSPENKEFTPEGHKKQVQKIRDKEAYSELMKMDNDYIKWLNGSEKFKFRKINDVDIPQFSVVKNEGEKLIPDNENINKIGIIFNFLATLDLVI